MSAPTSLKRNDTLSEVYTVPKESFLRRNCKPIVRGLACAAVVSLIMHLTPVMEAIRWTGQIIRWVFGAPAGIDHYPKPPEIKKQFEVAIDKAKDIARDHAAPKALPKTALPKAVPIVASVVAAKITPEIRVFKETARRIEGVEKKAEKIAKAGGDVAKAIDKTGDKAIAAAGGLAAGIEKKLHDRKEAKEKAQYDQLVARARDAGVKVDKEWTLEQLDAEVNKAEDKAWRKRWNAQCPNRRCRRPMRINSAATYYEQRICKGCQSLYSAGRARSLGPPPKPRH
jgi:hypothetical protein